MEDSNQKPGMFQKLLEKYRALQAAGDEASQGLKDTTANIYTKHAGMTPEEAQAAADQQVGMIEDATSMGVGSVKMLKPDMGFGKILQSNITKVPNVNAQLGKAPKESAEGLKKLAEMMQKRKIY